MTTVTRTEEVRRRVAEERDDVVTTITDFNSNAHSVSPTQRIKGAGSVIEAEFRYTRLLWLVASPDDESFKTRLSKVVEDLTADLVENRLCHNSTNMLENAIHEEQRRAAVFFLRQARSWLDRVTS